MFKNNYDAVEIGARIKKIRKENKMTQTCLAEKLFLSVDSISNIENGKTTCMPEYVVKICLMFDVSADYLYFGKRRRLFDDTQDNGIIELLANKLEKDIVRARKMLELLFEEAN